VMACRDFATGNRGPPSGLHMVSLVAVVRHPEGTKRCPAGSCDESKAQSGMRSWLLDLALPAERYGVTERRVSYLHNLERYVAT